jgi:hypothetical protein
MPKRSGVMIGDMVASTQVQKIVGIALNLAIFGFLGYEYVRTRDAFYIVLAVLVFFAPYVSKLLRSAFRPR